MKALLLTEAQRNEVQWLMPGHARDALHRRRLGVRRRMRLQLHPTGWLLAIEVIFALDGFIFLPLMGVGLRRVRFLALQAKHRGEMTEELREALADNVPVVFGTVITLTVPIMVWLAVFKPF